MRILSITTQKPNSTGSGVYLTELVRQFHKMGHEQAVVAGIDGNDTNPFLETVDFFPVYYNTSELPFDVVGMSDNMPYPSTRYNQLTEEMATQMERVFLKIVQHAIKNFKPDVLICHHLYFLTSIIREHFPHIKIIGICHGSDLRQLLKTDLQRVRIKENIAKLDVICALHDAQKQEIAEIYSVPAENIKVLGAGYDNEIFSNKHVPKDKAPVKIIFAGKISCAKGVISLLKALSMLQKSADFKLYLAGGYSDETEYQEILNLSNSQQFKVTFLGKLSHTELASHFNQCHIMVLPSFFEGLPLVLIEALACGLKVIATDLPGVKQWIDSNIPNNKIRYIKQPKMITVDGPCPKSLKHFEQELACAIQEEIENDNNEPVCLENATWTQVCAKVLNDIE